MANTKTNITDLALWELYAGFSALATMAQWGLPAEEEAERRHQTTLFTHTASETLLSR